MLNNSFKQHQNPIMIYSVPKISELTIRQNPNANHDLKWIIRGFIKSEDDTQNDTWVIACIHKMKDYFINYNPSNVLKILDDTDIVNCRDKMIGTYVKLYRVIVMIVY